MQTLTNLLMDIGFGSLVWFILLTVIVGIVRLISGKGLKSFPITAISVSSLVIALVPAIINLVTGKY